MFSKKLALAALFALFGAVLLAACQPTTETVEVEVTRVVTETVVEEGETVEVTVVVTETVVEEVVVEPEVEEEAVNKDLIVCMAQEPDTLYQYGGSMLVQSAVRHGLYTNYINTLSYDYQADGLVKIPSLADGDAVINSVEVNAGDTVLDSAGEAVTLEDGVEVTTSDGETVAFAGDALMMDQLVVTFQMEEGITWSDGEPVTADDSVYSFELASDPDTPSSKFTIERTASYVAVDDSTTEWTSIPGYMDSTYFVNFYLPEPRHVLEGYTAAEL